MALAPDIPGIDLVSFCIGASKANAESADTLAYYDIDTHESLTFGQLETLCWQVGSGLSNRLHVGPGDMVAVFAANCVQYAAVFFGVVSTGAACCTLSTTLSAAELARCVDDCAAKALVVGPEQIPQVQRALDAGLLRLASLAIFVLAKGRDPPPPSMTPFSALLCSAPYDRCVFNDADKAASTPAAVLYSSGTADLPKPVLLSHCNVVAALTITAAASLRYARTWPQRYLAILPFAHVFGLDSQIITSVAGGRTQFLMRNYTVDGFLRAIQEHRIEVAFVVPSVLGQIANHSSLEQYDLSSLQLLTAGGSPVPRDIHARIIERLGVEVVIGYGLTETCSGICAAVDGRSVTGSVGSVKAGTEVKIVDPETGRDVGAGEQGEVCVRGPTVMMGYLNRPDETKRAIDRAGFLHTGDIGHFSAEGHLFITDRSKDLIKYKGMQVAPAELEGLLMGHPLVVDAAVIGIEDRARATEVPLALVVPKGPAAAKYEGLGHTLDAWVAARVADYKRLRGGVVLVDHIPRNQAGKILRRELRAQYAARSRIKL
ncbi:hypothetical protein H4R19_000266 [Coemansia spiralis]|nr:hypothetical protein H4R19_000266 [Coemansia spiralis]